MAFKSKTVRDAVIVVASVAIIWVGVMIAFGTQNPFYVVSSGSMIPALEVYDIIVVQGHRPFDEVQVGDIIVFDRPSDHDRVIVHRVAAITDDDPMTVRTLGDANPASIPGTDFPITAEEYIGTVEHVIPQAGMVAQILTMKVMGVVQLNHLIIVAVVGIMVVRFMSKRKNEATLS